MTIDENPIPKRRGRPPKVRPDDVIVPGDDDVTYKPDPNLLGQMITHTMEMQKEELGEQPPQPPLDARKAEDWQAEPNELPWQQVRCRECNTFMWVRQPERHDLCEECGWTLREQIQQMYGEQRAQLADRFVNPFMGNDIWGQSGSLPTEKK